MDIVIVGHVDHGKSTVIGRLLADTGSLPKGKLEQVRSACRRNAKPFEYAFLLDALREEQAQGITIDSARIFFKSKKRDYLIIDAPGHIEFLKNMVSGAARAEAALLVIDAKEGIQENSKRHGYLLSMLGVRQAAVCVNKMDLVGYDQKVFEKIEKAYRKFLKGIGLTAEMFIPLAAREGENIVQRSARMPWFTGPSALEVLDSFAETGGPDQGPLRMPVQGVYKFTESGDDRRIVAGRVESGRLAVGDPVVFLPSRKRSVVRSIEVFSAPARQEVSAGFSTGVTLAEQIYVRRGEVMCRVGETLPAVSTLAGVELFWMGRRPMSPDRGYSLKIGTARFPVRLKKIERVIDASSLDRMEKAEVGRHDVAQCVLETALPAAFDLSGGVEATGRFVIVDDYDIAGGGIVREVLPDGFSEVRDQTAQRQEQWDFSGVEPELRARRYGHQPAWVLLTGGVGLNKKGIARALEQKLFERGTKSYFLPMGNLLRGLNADPHLHRLHRESHVRRFGEVAHLFLEAGLIVVATASNLTDEELGILQEVTDRERIRVVHVGENSFREGRVDLNLDPRIGPEENAGIILRMLEGGGLLAAE